MALSASRRVTLIREIASRLGTEDWHLIDVTLKQFGLPTSDAWRGSSDAYVVAMAERAVDQTLIDLALHVGFRFEEPTPHRVDPPFWRDGMLRVFLSHLAAHRVFAGELQTALHPFSISVFVAHNDIEPTAEWQTQIETALATCDALVALLHPDFHASKWTDQEIGFAMGRGLPAFAVRFGQDPYGFIGRFQAFEGKGKETHALADELFDAFCRNRQTQRRMSEVVVRLFEESGSFAQAKERVEMVALLRYWEPSFSSRIQQAVKDNDQIGRSFKVPDRVAAIVKERA